MAKQSKKSTARRVPKAAEPRMYGDGKPAPAAEAPQAPAAEPAKTTAAGRTPATRTAGATPRGGGATYTRVDRIVDYSYVLHDLRRLGITAVAILGGLVVLGIIIH